MSVGELTVPLSVLAALLLIVGQEAPPAPLPSSVHCAALFSLTHEALRQKSGDPAMTQGFAEDAAALRKIVIAEQGSISEAEARADATIAVEKKAIAAERAARAARGVEPAEEDLNPCYRVKALGPRGE